MNHRVVRSGLFALALTGAVAFAQAEQGGAAKHDEGGASAVATCPVMGEPINFAVSTETDKGPVFFCCPKCIDKFKANPAKFASKVDEQRKVLAARAKVQVTCPVTREPVDPKVFVESNGKKVFFCCKGCVKKYQRDSAKYASALANSYTFQTKCPVTGEDIDPEAFSELASGKKVYYCCEGCDKKFFKDPQKFAKRLEAQGFTLGAKDMAPAGTDGHEGHDHGDHDGHDDHDH